MRRKVNLIAKIRQRISSALPSRVLMTGFCKHFLVLGCAAMRRQLAILVALALAVPLIALPVAAQEHHHHHAAADPAAEFLMQQASGTSANPAAEREHLMWSAGSWQVMLHALASVNSLRATGPRGGEKEFSTNWGMLMAQRPLGGGHLMLRTMLSLEPATISGRSYPELFQTGETAFGRHLIDGQHPHDLFMELAAEYARAFGPRSFGYLYVAPVGDPALGPVAFPHRDSGLEIPQATLGHHFEDSTHIASNVITAGYGFRALRVEASAFHGAEPDEERWDLDGGPLDSTSVRLTFTARPSFVAQVSGGYLTKPEKLEPGDQRRASASVSYTRGGWASSAIWGRVYKESHDNTVQAMLVESTLRFLRRHTLMFRVEDTEKDELFPHAHPTGQIERPALPVATFRIRAATAGYTFDVYRRGALRIGAGGNYTWYRFPDKLNGFYGERPRTKVFYVRARLGT
jgi:hypothetical protein